ncbi:MAG: hypothetical protein ACC652_03930, partial [Acidimicrobiales bacterium]
MIRRVHELSRHSLVAGVLAGALVASVAIGWQVGVFARSRDTTGTTLVQALETAQQSGDISELAEQGISLSVQNVGSRRLVTVAMLDEHSYCLLARSSGPEFVEFAGTRADQCSAKLGADPSLEWMLDS